MVVSACLSEKVRRVSLIVDSTAEQTSRRCLDSATELLANTKPLSDHEPTHEIATCTKQISNRKISQLCQSIE